MTDNQKDRFRASMEENVRTHAECLEGLVKLLDGQEISIEGKRCTVTAVCNERKNAISVEVLNPTENTEKLIFAFYMESRITKE